MGPTKTYNTERYANAEEAARIKGIKPWVIRQWMKDGKVAVLKVEGFRPLVVLADIDRLIRESTVEVANPARTARPELAQA